MSQEAGNDADITVTTLVKEWGVVMGGSYLDAQGEIQHRSWALNGYDNEVQVNTKEMTGAEAALNRAVIQAFKDGRITPGKSLTYEQLGLKPSD